MRLADGADASQPNHHLPRSALRPVAAAVHIRDGVVGCEGLATVLQANLPPSATPAHANVMRPGVVCRQFATEAAAEDLRALQPRAGGFDGEGAGRQARALVCRHAGRFVAPLHALLLFVVAQHGPAFALALAFRLDGRRRGAGGVVRRLTTVARGLDARCHPPPSESSHAVRVERHGRGRADA